MQVEPIEDINNEEVYIADLEQEITALRQENKRLIKSLQKAQQVAQQEVDKDVSCCEAYKVLQKNFQKLLDDIIPF